jgi:hypothetical protein
VVVDPYRVVEELYCVVLCGTAATSDRKAIVSISASNLQSARSCKPTHKKEQRECQAIAISDAVAAEPR